MADTTDDLATRLAGLQRAMAAPPPSGEEIRAGIAADKAMAGRLRPVLPGVPQHHIYAVLQALRTRQLLDAAAGCSAGPQETVPNNTPEVTR